MSWRDRLPKRDPGDFSGPANRAGGPFGTTGTIGNEAFLTTARTIDAEERPSPDHELSRRAFPGSRAVSVKSVERADTCLHIATETDAISAKSANSADDAHPAEGERDASSAESADRAGVRDHRLDDHEHSATIEGDGRLLAAWAKGFAQLDPDRPPAHVPPSRWSRLVDDVGRFLDGGWADRAAALGWGSCDLFGSDRDKPFARIDRAGLLWLLNGHRLIALSPNTATIETQTGTRQTYRRKPDEPGRVLPWEIAP
jgi:hypothetical protein